MYEKTKHGILQYGESKRQKPYHGIYTGSNTVRSPASCQKSLVVSRLTARGQSTADSSYSCNILLLIHSIYH